MYRDRRDTQASKYKFHLSNLHLNHKARDYMDHRKQALSLEFIINDLSEQKREGLTILRGGGFR